MKRRMKTWVLVAAAAAVGTLSCSQRPAAQREANVAQRPAAPAAAAETYREFLTRVGGESALYRPLEAPVTVALLGVSKTHEYQLRRDATARATADAMRVKLLLDHYESDVATQRSKAENMLVRGAQSLISTARDDESFAALAAYLDREKVFLVGEGGTNDTFRRAELPWYGTYVGVDNYRNGFQGGAWAAAYFQRNFAGRPPRLVVAGYPSTKATVQRAEGFIQGFKSVDPRLEILFNDGVGGGGGRDQVLPFVENVFTAHQFNIFFAVWDEAAMAGLAAARTRKLTRKDLMIVGYDGTFEVARLIAAGQTPLVADIAQTPELSGRVSVSIAARLAAGQWKPEDLPMFIWTDGTVVTRDNANSYLKSAGQEAAP